MVHRLLVIAWEDLEAVMHLDEAFQVLRTALPETHITVLTPYSSHELTFLRLWADRVLDDWAVKRTGPVSASLPFELSDVITRLRQQSFDAAIVFTSQGRSPYLWAYLCYLAGIPIRLGQSQEFGGGVLSQQVLPSSDSSSPSDDYRHLLASVGFPIIPSAKLWGRYEELPSHLSLDAYQP